MLLKNKKTGEIVGFGYLQSDHVAPLVLTTYKNDRPEMHTYNSLAELNAEWEDQEEPKGNWTIDPMNENCIDDGRYTAPDELERYEELGLKFNNKEEAVKAVEKLKAWKRLKDRNLTFNTNYSTSGADINHKDVILCRIEAYFDDKWEEENMKAEEDLDLLLGGEE